MEIPRKALHKRLTFHGEECFQRQINRSDSWQTLRLQDPCKIWCLGDAMMAFLEVVGRGTICYLNNTARMIAGFYGLKIPFVQQQHSVINYNIYPKFGQ